MSGLSRTITDSAMTFKAKCLLLRLDFPQRLNATLSANAQRKLWQERKQRGLRSVALKDERVPQRNINSMVKPLLSKNFLT